MLKLFKNKAMLILMALMSVGTAFAQEGGASIDTATINGMLRQVASGINSIAQSVSSIIAPAMIGLVVVLTLLAIVIKVAKKPRSAS
ncbi:MAG: hypothetical protein IK012_05130 [Fibrobacter sp.]|uniref:hypothetical protein n=1 Tax=Fibrobacter sp. TaxID=35828 RepID=UPI0025BE29AE|nr:hypothetical protein [Fibrobacter sp.]MBR4784621.1 hypothetical protein [Fibrobacter sp.]